MAQTPEGRVKDRIKKWMKREYPDAWYFLPVSRGYGIHGIPDFICCMPVTITPAMVGLTIGAFVGIEAKTATGELSLHQAQRLQEILNASGEAIVVRGPTSEVDEQLDALKNKLTTLG